MNRKPFKIEKNITIEQIRALKPKMIYYGSRTCWWTHDPAHLGSTKPLPERYRPRGAGANFGGGLPCDPRGGVLYQATDFEKFLNMAEKNAEHYGKHGLDAFIASHHSNCKTDDGIPWCFETFAEYNEIIDQQINDNN